MNMIFIIECFILFSINFTFIIECFILFIIKYFDKLFVSRVVISRKMTCATRQPFVDTPQARFFPFSFQ